MPNPSHSYRLPLTLAGAALLLASALPLRAARPATEADLHPPVAPPLPEQLAATDPAPGTPLLTAPDAGPVLKKAPRSQNATINLINRLVQKGILTRDESQELINQAEEDAAEARAEAEGAHAGAAPPDQAGAPSTHFTPPLFPDAQVAAPPPPSDDTVRVTYIPETVKSQIRDQIRDEVMAQARDEGWAAPRTMPEWVTRMKLFGDIRVRYEGDFFPSGNDNTGGFPIFNSINTGAPFDTSGTVFSPQFNVDQNRERIRLRARFGIDSDLGDGFTAGFRIGTGENDSPVTENQTLGAANNGQGGNFSKYSLWLDRAFLRYELGGLPEKDLTISVGRFDNPFFGTNLLWANDLGFDGAVIQGRYAIAKGVTPFLTIGAFPVFNTDLNFATTNPAKFKSEDKWLAAAQTGVTVRFGKDLSGKFGAAYYDYVNIQGKLSSPFTPLTTSDQGNTDDSRPAFAQNGNTYMALRDIVPNALNGYGTIDQFQYYGLATPFHELNFTGRLDFTHYEPFQISVIGDYVKNLAYYRSAIEAKAVNNRGPNTTSGNLGKYAGSDNAFLVALQVGHPALEKFGDWNASVGYRWVGSDSVVDGFNDSDFGAPLTGTNLKGYTLTGSFALSPRVYLFIRWMSADSIAGPQFKSDILQFDINGKF